MRDIPQLRRQSAYNCGLYSIWMAIESISRIDNSLGKKIEHAAKIYSKSMGGVFDYVTMERIIEFLGFKARKVRFHDRNSFLSYVNNHLTNAILLAYSFNALKGEHFGPDIAAGSAHWSVAERLDVGWNYVTLANPHGTRNLVSVNDIVGANLQLREGRFGWRSFTSDERGSRMFAQEAKKYKNTPDELNKRGREKIYLAGFFVAVWS